MDMENQNINQYTPTQTPDKYSFGYIFRNGDFYLFFGPVCCLLFFILMSQVAGKATRVKLLTLLLISFILIFAAGYAAYRYALSDNPELSFFEFINAGFSWSDVFGPTFWKVFAIGMVTNLIFGFIDNAGLFFGMDALDPYLPGGELTKAGYGNTFSDTLGVFLGAFIGFMVEKYYGVKETPLMSDIVGIILGCLLGVWVPKMLTGKE